MDSLHDERNSVGQTWINFMMRENLQDKNVDRLLDDGSSVRQTWIDFMMKEDLREK